MPKAIAIDSWTLARILTLGELPPKWPTSFADPATQLGAVRIEKGDVIYFFGPLEKIEPQLLVIDGRKESGLFEGLAENHRAEAFARLCRAAHASFFPGRGSIPAKWGPYHAGSRLSFFAQHIFCKHPYRMELDLNPRSSSHVYAYCLGTHPRQLADVQIDYSAFDCAIRHLDDAMLEAMEKMAAAPRIADEVRHTLLSLGTDERLGLGLSTKQWLDRLTHEQRDFVACGLHRSIRLVGSAGTGKTLSLLVKCLIEYEKRAAAPGGYRGLFLTFSQTNVNHITTAIACMDHEGVLNRWPGSSLKVTTIQSLAYESLRLDLYGLAPVSGDGIEGRNWQRWILEEILEKYRVGDWVTRRQRCSEWVRTGIEALKGSPSAVTFVNAVMNEFACVVEPQGVRKGAAEREAYLKAQRRAWMVDLPSRDDRLCVLDLYERFRTQLREEACIGADQLTADFLVELGTNRWDSIREREGFDVVFVDELHLFNRQERMIPHLLMRNTRTPPIVVMAYDFKQSTRVTFGTQWDEAGPLHLSRDMGLGETERFELSAAFRYTPEIAAMLEWVDQAIPAAGIAEELGDEWRKIASESRRDAGRKPSIVVVENTQATYDIVFRRAQLRARFLKRGSLVAVLCLSEQLFETYVNAGAHRDKFLAITDREQLSGAFRSGQKFILSMPEFVAGMQFDTVYLIEVNEGEVGEGPDYQGRSLQFVTQVYLGASRAETVLEIFANRDRGGASPCLVHAIQHGALDVLSLDELPDPASGARPE
jgi:hypothetical protein